MHEEFSIIIRYIDDGTRKTISFSERMMNMKRSWKLLFCSALVGSLCIAGTFSAQADTSIGSANNILSITDNATGEDVRQKLTDGSTVTAWVQPEGVTSPDLTLTLNHCAVGEIWVRNGYCYSQNYYYAYGRPATLVVTLTYNSGRDTVTYRYQLEDAFQPNLSTDDWSQGYQRLLLPQEYTQVTRIDLTVEEAVASTNYRPAISDISIASGVHATATPYVYTTATPRPYVDYVTPTPGAATSTPVPTSNVPTAQPSAEPTTTPVRSTDVPAPTPEPVYPSTGTVALLNQKAATRSGPGTRFDEPGTFYSAGDAVNVISKAWDDDAGLWWYQIELSTSDGWIRAYTPAKRVDLDTSLVPTEDDLNDMRTVLTSGPVYFGPSTTYRKYGWSWIYEGDNAKICAISGDWAQVEYYSYAKDVTRRGWVKLDTLSEPAK